MAFSSPRGIPLEGDGDAGEGAACGAEVERAIAGEAAGACGAEVERAIAGEAAGEAAGGGGGAAAALGALAGDGEFVAASTGESSAAAAAAAVDEELAGELSLPKRFSRFSRAWSLCA